jgi:hypothetical protein
MCIKALQSCCFTLRISKESCLEIPSVLLDDSPAAVAAAATDRPLMLLPLKLHRDKPLQRQLYEQLLQLIMSSQLAAGTRMPSTRMLADQLSISRITAVLTYERLIAEGYLRTMPEGHFRSSGRRGQHLVHDSGHGRQS